MNVASFLTKAARTFAARPAVSLGTEPYCTYEGLVHRVAQLAGTLTHRCGLQPGDRVALAMSNSPEYIEVLYAVWHAGLTAVPMNARLHPREFAYILEHSGARLCFATPDLLVELIAAYQDVTCFFAPTMVTRLVNHPTAASVDPHHLKTLIYGGGPMYVEDLRHTLHLFGPKLVQIYGQGEAPMTITALAKAFHADTNHPRYLERLGSAGIARSDVEVRVVDADDRDLPPGEVGEVLVRGDVVMRGYWHNPQASAETLRGAGCIPATWAPSTRTAF
jgi:acyl-CoA synthetase (AMP-forming)/AMP-acid ligase II